MSPLFDGLFRSLLGSAEGDKNRKYCHSVALRQPKSAEGAARGVLRRQRLRLDALYGMAVPVKRGAGRCVTEDALHAPLIFAMPAARRNAFVRPRSRLVLSRT